MSEPLEIHGHELALSEGRSVWAGERDESWYIRFDNGKGDLTRIRISFEAADALVRLLTHNEEPYERILRYIVTAAADKCDLKWVAVPESADTPAALSSPDGNSP